MILVSVCMGQLHGPSRENKILDGLVSQLHKKDIPVKNNSTYNNVELNHKRILKNTKIISETIGGVKFLRL